MLNETELNSAIAKVLGDYQNQYSVEIASEIKNTIRWITTNYVFLWNTVETISLPHVNGIVELPANTGKILQIIDSTGEENYVLSPKEKFQVYQRGTTDIYPSTGRKPFSLSESRLTGALSLIFGNPDDIDTDLTFNILHTEVYSSVAEIIGLDRLYPAILGRTVHSMLIQTENPDTALLNMYDKMFQECIIRERDFSNNRALQQFNTAVVAPNLMIDRKSKGI